MKWRHEDGTFMRPYFWRLAVLAFLECALAAMAGYIVWSIFQQI
jgi:hypothetical protein